MTNLLIDLNDLQILVRYPIGEGPHKKDVRDEMTTETIILFSGTTLKVSKSKRKIVNVL